MIPILPLKDPRVSIIMAMQDSSATIAVAIRSIQAQTLTDWELILVDDGSRDDSVAIARSFDEPRLRLFCDGERRGLAARLNQAIAQTRGAFIARMDADDVCFPERLSRQIALLEQDPRLDLVGCSAVVFTERDGAVGLLPIGETHRQIVARPFDGFPLPHPTWCGRAVWFRAHPYDARLAKAQDQDVLLRSFATSRFGGTHEVLVAYRQDRLDLRKMLTGRALFAGSLWRHARSGGYGFAVKGIARHACKAVIDIGLAACGLSRWSQRRKLQPLSPEAVERWQSLRAQLGLSREHSPCAE